MISFGDIVAITGGTRVKVLYKVFSTSNFVLSSVLLCIIIGSVGDLIIHNGCDGFFFSLFQDVVSSFDDCLLVLYRTGDFASFSSSYYCMLRKKNSGGCMLMQLLLSL